MRTGGFCQWFQSRRLFLFVVLIVRVNGVFLGAAAGGELLNAVFYLLFNNAYILAMRCGRCSKTMPWKAGINTTKMKRDNIVLLDWHTINAFTTCSTKRVCVELLNALCSMLFSSAYFLAFHFYVFLVGVKGRQGYPCICRERCCFDYDIVLLAEQSLALMHKEALATKKD